MRVSSRTAERNGEAVGQEHQREYPQDGEVKVAASTTPAEVITPAGHGQSAQDPGASVEVLRLFPDSGHQDDVVVDASGRGEHERE